MEKTQMATENKDSLSIILPVLNEEKKLKDVVTEIISTVRLYITDFEIIIIDDGSYDKSFDIGKTLSIQYPEVHVLRNFKNEGYGSVIRKGIWNAKKYWFLIMDADGQLKIEALEGFWKYKESYDFIIGYRKKRADNIYRRGLGRLGCWVANFFFNTEFFVKDVNCAFKLFKTSELKAISFHSTGGAINFEVLYNLFKKKRKFAQLPLNHFKRDGGKATGGNPNVLAKIVTEGIKILLRT